jgi:NitT/TauT family transport system substrate-binding protein
MELGGSIMRSFHIIAGVIAFAGQLVCASAQTTAPTPLKVGYDGNSMTTAPMYYAQKKGIFKKYNLDVTMVYIDGGTTLSQAVVGGSVDIGQNGYTPAAAAAVQGADIVFIGGISNKLPFQLVVKKEIKTADDLRGKKLAISRLGSSSDTAATIALDHFKLKRSDVTLLQLGGEGTRTAAMMSGQIDGSFEQYPRTAELEEQGYWVMADCTILAGDYPNTSYVSTRRYLKDHGDVAKRFLMAISEALALYRKDKPEALKLTAEFLKTPETHALSETYDRYVADVFPVIPYPSKAGLTLVLAEIASKNPAAAHVTPEQISDVSALDALVKDHFFDTLK